MPDIVGDGQAHRNMLSGNIAMPWYEGGASVVPIQPNGTKKPIGNWKALQTERMSREQVERTWSPGSSVGVAVICGAVSGNLEMTEIEADAMDSTSISRLEQELALRAVEDIWLQLTTLGYAELTPSGGLHILYRIPDHVIPGNTKLALRLARDDELNDDEREIRRRAPEAKFPRTRAETRGEGGYVIVAPTNGRCHPSHEPWETIAGQCGVIPIITWSQRMAIHAALTAALDEMPAPDPAPIQSRQAVAIRPEDGERPGDVFQRTHSWDEPWFTDLGWKISHRMGNETFWTRPGKNVRDGHSASTGYRGDKDNLYVWSPTAGLPTEEPLGKFFVYAHYYYNGDLTAAARGLRAKGYIGQALIPAQSQALTPWEPVEAGEIMELPSSDGPIDTTDTGNGRRMKESHGDRFRYNTREKCWYVWSGVAWVKDEHLAIERAAEEAAEATIEAANEALMQAFEDDEIKNARKVYGAALQLKNQGKLQAAISRFAAQEGISVVPEQFNLDPNLLNLRNGILDLESGELRPHNSTDMITLTFGAELDKDAECPLFKAFLEQAIPNIEVREYVQRAMGYSLMGKPQERVMFLLHGPSGTGKSVLTATMTKVFGDYGGTAPASTFRLKRHGGDTLDLHQLRGRRFVASSELPEGAQLDEDLVKRITGGDMVTSRALYEGYSAWKPQCVIWIGTNFLPKVNSDDNAIWRRAKTILMDTVFGIHTQDEILGYADVLAAEANGILNWLLEGLDAYRLRGLLQPEAVTMDIEAYRTEVDVVACFIRDRIEDGALIKDEEAEMRAAELRRMFDNYCIENHHQQLGARRYSNRLKALGYVPFKLGGVAMLKGLRINLEHGVLGSF